MKEEKKKWVMPKFLPHKYDVKLINEDKVRICISSQSATLLYFHVLFTILLMLTQTLHFETNSLTIIE